MKRRGDTHIRIDICQDESATDWQCISIKFLQPNEQNFIMLLVWKLLCPLHDLHRTNFALAVATIKGS